MALFEKKNLKFVTQLFLCNIDGRLAVGLPDGKQSLPYMYAQLQSFLFVPCRGITPVQPKWYLVAGYPSAPRRVGTPAGRARAVPPHASLSGNAFT